MSSARTWDIFCKVVDNYGDAAVCWRLAQQLAIEHGSAVRLWMSDLATLHALCPKVAIGIESQWIAGVEVRAWRNTWAGIQPARCVVEGFGCGLPEEYIRTMGASEPRPLWIVLEYLSAERWVPEHHGLPSPHPRWRIPRYFFFPGFVPGTGGVPREAGFRERRTAFADEARSRMWRAFGYEPPPRESTVVSMFGYDDAPGAQLVSAWCEARAPMVVAVPEGGLAVRIAAQSGERAIAGRAWRPQGDGVEVRVLPFVEQSRYDELLWSCECNFVRGEDSFLRAQWAALPLVWNVYPQSDAAHWRKLTAFLELYCAGLPQAVTDGLVRMWRTWNGAPGEHPGAAWRDFWAHREALNRHAHGWRDRLAGQDDLARNLVKFCCERLQY